jgi:thymidylate synthase
MEITAKTSLEAWKKSLRYIIESGKDFTDKDGRICREAFNLTVNITDFGSEVETPIDIMQNFDWVYPSKEELASIILNKEELAGYEFSYGPRLFNYIHSKDQINDFIIPLLKNDPFTRRAVISLFNPLADSNMLSKNIPSLMLIYFKIQDGKLNISVCIRSNDIFIGWPGNIYQLLILQKFVAEKLGLGPGIFTTISFSAHIFMEHQDMINKILQR